MDNNNYSSSHKRARIQYYTPDETRRMMNQQSNLDKQNKYGHQKSYNNANNFDAKDFNYQHTPEYANQIMMKRHRHHVIGGWIGAIVIIAIIAVGGVTVYGGHLNNRPSQDSASQASKPINEQDTTTKAQKPQAPKPKVKIKRVIEKPNNDGQNKASKEKAEQMQKDIDDAKAQAKNSADYAKKEATTLKQQVQSGQTKDKLNQKINDLENKLNGYTQQPNSQQPYNNNPKTFPTGIQNNNNQ